MIQEFKKFVMRGNVVDLAVGIIIGSAFKGITTSFVKDVIMPPIGQVTGGVDFSEWVIPLDFLNFGREVSTAAATLNIGNFLNVVIDFLITAAAIFVLIKFVNQLQDVVEDLTEEEEEQQPRQRQNPSQNLSQNLSQNRIQSRALTRSWSPCWRSCRRSWTRHDSAAALRYSLRQSRNSARRSKAWRKNKSRLP